MPALRQRQWTYPRLLDTLWTCAATAIRAPHFRCEGVAFGVDREDPGGGGQQEIMYKAKKLQCIRVNLPEMKLCSSHHTAARVQVGRGYHAEAGRSGAEGEQEGGCTRGT